MNVELLLKVKKRILKQPRRLNMGWVVRKDPECGTVMCIAGHTLAEAGYKAEHYPTFSCFEFSGNRDWFTQAAKLLDILPSQANRLFFPTFPGLQQPDKEFTAEDAARAIDRLIAGEIQLW